VAEPDRGDEQAVERGGVMTTLFVAVAFVLTAYNGASAEAPKTGPVIDLDRPGALEALQRSNPAHYAKVRQIIAGVVRRADAEVPRWMQASFNAHDVRYAPIVLTSHPPKRHLAFALDTTRYEAIVTLTNVRGEIIPAAPRP
jgi:hypothetical protein